MKWPTKNAEYRPSRRNSPRVTTWPSAGSGAGEETPGGAVEPLHLDEHAQEARIRHIGRRARTRRRCPGAPAYSSPQPSHRTDMLMSVGWVSTRDSAKQPQQVRVGRVVVHDEPGVDGDHALVGREHVVGVRVTAEAVIGLVERDVVLLLEQVRGGEARHPAHRSRRHACGRVRRCMGRPATTSGETGGAPGGDRRVRWGGRARSPATMAATNSVASRCHRPARSTMPCPLRGTRTHAVSVATAGQRARRTGPTPRRSWSCRGCRAGPRGPRPRSCSTGSPSGSHGGERDDAAHRARAGGSAPRHARPSSDRAARPAASPKRSAIPGERASTSASASGRRRSSPARGTAGGPPRRWAGADRCRGRRAPSAGPRAGATRPLRGCVHALRAARARRPWVRRRRGTCDVEPGLGGGWRSLGGDLR